MKKTIYIFFLVLSALLNGQTTKIEATKMGELYFGADEFVGYDGFGNCFYIKNNVLFKKFEETTFQYQNLALGKIAKVDILNPLKIVIFYSEFNAVVVVDNQMNEIQKIHFSTLNDAVIASAVGISGQNKIWVYNSLNQQIGLYDLINATYQNLGVPIQEDIRYYQSDFNYFHWIDSQNNWNTCTIFGRFFTNAKVEASNVVQLIEIDRFFFVEENKVFLKDPKQNRVYEITNVEKSFKKIYYKDQILSIFTDKGITNYKITLP